jgi:hypothetical protein
MATYIEERLFANTYIEERLFANAKKNIEENCIRDAGAAIDFINCVGELGGLGLMRQIAEKGYTSIEVVSGHTPLNAILRRAPPDFLYKIRGKGRFDLDLTSVETDGKISIILYFRPPRYICRPHGYYLQNILKADMYSIATLGCKRVIRFQSGTEVFGMSCDETRMKCAMCSEERCGVCECDGECGICRRKLCNVCSVKNRCKVHLNSDCVLMRTMFEEKDE